MEMISGSNFRNTLLLPHLTDMLNPGYFQSSSSRNIWCCSIWLISCLCISSKKEPSGFAQQEHVQVGENSGEFRFSRVEDGVQVFIDEDLFTHLRIKPFAKPILYPIYVDKEIGMTRNWPMRTDVKNEPVDHPHHKSLWVGHIINGVDFWTESAGRVVVRDLQINEAKQQLIVTSDWLRTIDDKRICSDQTLYSFGTHDNARWIDVRIEFSSSENDLRFGDTKEGTFAIRTHPNLQLTAAKEAGSDACVGTARNSESITGQEIWGKKAKWVLYQGSIEGEKVAIAMLDHPDNIRHPTTWHARDYGLISANPFGLHEFTGKPAGAGEVVVVKGEKVSLRYRVLFIKGEPNDVQVEKWYRAFESW